MPRFCCSQEILSRKCLYFRCEIDSRKDDAPGTGLTTSHILWHDEMPEVRKDFFFPTAEHAEIAEIRDGIYRISGFVKEYGISFNQFLIDDEQPTLIHTGPIGMYKKVEE